MNAVRALLFFSPSNTSKDDPNQRNRQRQTKEESAEYRLLSTRLLPLKVLSRAPDSNAEKPLKIPTTPNGVSCILFRNVVQEEFNIVRRGPDPSSPHPPLLS